MDRVKLAFKNPENKTIEYNGVKIEVIPFMSAPQQAFLINRYVKEYFFTEGGGGFVEDSEYKYLEAEFSLMNYIFQSSTNIDVDGMENDLYVDSALWENITSQIVNYKEFREKLNAVVEGVKTEISLKNSTGRVVAGLMEKITGILSEVSKANPDEIAKMQETSMELMKKLEETSVLGNQRPPSVEIQEEARKAMKKEKNDSGKA